MKALAIVALLCAVAAADTGGSVGGGNWSSGHTAIPDTPSRPTAPDTFGTTHIPVYRPPTYTPRTYTPPTTYTPPSDERSGSGAYVVDLTPMPVERDWFFDHFNYFFGAMLLFIAGMFLKDTFFPNATLFPDRLASAFQHADDVDVSVLRVAIDGRARKFAQNAMKQLAANASTATDEGRVQLLRDTTLLVRGLRDAWVYAGADDDPIRDLEHAKQAFDRHVDDARSRFLEETLRNEQGKTTTLAASAYTPHSEEGEGLVLVTFVIAARQELYTVKKIRTGDELRAALESASTLDVYNLVAVEIVWQPTEDSDRLSSVELEAKLPGIVRLPGALVGKTFCAYCGGPYPAELVSCPHCGASGRQAA
jgi:Protein of unknown function (DUF1517)